MPRRGPPSRQEAYKRRAEGVMVPQDFWTANDLNAWVPVCASIIRPCETVCIREAKKSRTSPRMRPIWHFPLLPRQDVWGPADGSHLPFYFCADGPLLRGPDLFYPLGFVAGLGSRPGGCRVGSAYRSSPSLHPWQPTSGFHNTRPAFPSSS